MSEVQKTGRARTGGLIANAVADDDETQAAVSERPSIRPAMRESSEDRAAKRAAELAHGGRPLVPTMPNDERSHLDIALLEIVEGKIVIVEQE
jgi:hypothetical protein